MPVPLPDPVGEGVALPLSLPVGVGEPVPLAEPPALGEAVGVPLPVGVGVGEPVPLTEPPTLGEGVGVPLPVGVPLLVGVGVGVGVGVPLPLSEPELLGVLEALEPAVTLAVFEEDTVEVGVTEAERVEVGVPVGLRVPVPVGEGEGVAVGVPVVPPLALAEPLPETRPLGEPLPQGDALMLAAPLGDTVTRGEPLGEDGGVPVLEGDAQGEGVAVPGAEDDARALPLPPAEPEGAPGTHTAPPSLSNHPPLTPLPVAAGVPERLPEAQAEALREKSADGVPGGERDAERQFEAVEQNEAVGDALPLALLPPVAVGAPEALPLPLRALLGDAGELPEGGAAVPLPAPGGVPLGEPPVAEREALPEVEALVRGDGESARRGEGDARAESEVWGDGEGGGVPLRVCMPLPEAEARGVAEPLRAGVDVAEREREGEPLALVLNE